MGEDSWTTFGRALREHRLGGRWLGWEISYRVVFACVIVGMQFWTPPERPLMRQDAYKHAYPITDTEIVPNRMVVLYIALVVPLCIIPLLFVRFIKGHTWRRIADEGLVYFLGITATIINAALFTEFVKRFVGRYRPDYLSRCTGVSDPKILFNLIENMQEYDVFPCTLSSHFVDDGRQSFPSGHASTSFAAYGFLGIWLYNSLLGYKRLGFWSMGASLSVLLVPVWIGLSRVVDVRHHWTDVFGGTIIGTVAAILCFHFYYKMGKNQFPRTLWPVRESPAPSNRPPEAPMSYLYRPQEVHRPQDPQDILIDVRPKRVSPNMVNLEKDFTEVGASPKIGPGTKTPTPEAEASPTHTIRAGTKTATWPDRNEGML